MSFDRGHLKNLFFGTAIGCSALVMAMAALKIRIGIIEAIILYIFIKTNSLNADFSLYYFNIVEESSHLSFEY